MRNKRSPFDPLVPGNFTVTDLTEEELMQIIRGGERQNAERARRQRKADVLDAFGEAQIASPQDGSNPFVRCKTHVMKLWKTIAGSFRFSKCEICGCVETAIWWSR